MNVAIVRSARKTLALEVRRDLTVLARAPMRMPRSEIERFVRERADWIEKTLAKMRARPEHAEADEKTCREAAARTLPERIQKYAPLVGAYPTHVSVTGARTRFGSCGAQNRLCFSWRLFAYPDAAIDYVVVHELCHILHHDHSPAFWREVARVMPDYKERKALLR